MTRCACLALAAFGLASCAPSRTEVAATEQPAWFAARVAEAEAKSEADGYPSLAEFPAYRRTGGSQAAWEAGVAAMEQMRQEVLDDPALIDPDAAASAEDLARRSRADAEAAIRRQNVEED
jgi:hypothetical protein